MTKVVVTGIGIISSIGKNLPETFESLVNKRSGISHISILDTIHKNEFLLGEIKLTNDELVKIAAVDPDKAWTRTTLLGIVAANQAVADAGIVPDSTTALVSATTVGGMDSSELYYKDFLSDAIHADFIDTHHAGSSTEMIAENCGIAGIITTISTACSSALNAIMFGSRLIQSGKAERVIVGGTDALSKFTLNGFKTLMILDNELCRPLDASRSGLNLGEGAAYLVLESAELAIKHGKKVYAEVSGAANANDAHHQTASSDDGEGPYLAMKNALESAGLEPSDIGYINAHGTGTENNDVTESKALIRIFKNNMPLISSTKAFTGHTLGASGVIESVISIIALNNEIAPPNINFTSAIVDTNIIPVTEIVKIKGLKHVITNSFGFGGNDSSVIFSAFDGRKESLNKLSFTGEAVYITGTGCVSPQNSLSDDFINEEVVEQNERFLQITAPKYRDYIDPKKLRRMSKIIRMGMVSANVAMKDSGIEKPDAIITGTGMGCQADTEKFLNQMIDDNEGLLAPTSFIQSTHNTVGGTIALHQKNHNYNITYVHRTFSFESALMDSILLINSGQKKNILLGGFDEITEESWLIKTKINYYKSQNLNNLQLFNDKQEGAQAGQGSAFFVITDEKTDNAYAKVDAVDMFFRPENGELEKRIVGFLNNYYLAPDEIDLVIFGRNGDDSFDGIYDEVDKNLFATNFTANYKQLCGEYDTSSAFAMWLASVILKNNAMPKGMMPKGNKPDKIRNVLIYNHFRNVNHSLILLSEV